MTSSSVRPTTAVEPVIARFSAAVPGAVIVLLPGRECDVVNSPEEALAHIQRWARRRSERTGKIHVTVLSWENVPAGFVPPPAVAS